GMRVIAARNRLFSASEDADGPSSCSAVSVFAIAVQSPTLRVLTLYFVASAESFASSRGCVSVTTCLSFSTATSTSSPSAGLTSSRQLSFVCCSTSFRRTLPTVCHRAEVRSVFAATNATASPGTTDAAPSSAPGRLAVALAQPAVTIAATAARAAGGINLVISLLGWLAPHQRRDKLREALAREYRAHSLRYRQFDAEPEGEFVQHRRGRDPLDGLPDLRDRLVRAQSLRDQLACVPVAPVAAPARDDQVAHAGEPGEGLGPRSRGLPEPRHLGETARDQRRLRVVAEIEAVDAACREPDHVLRRRTELDADHVGVHIRAEDGRVDCVLQLACEKAVVARDHGCGRQADGDLLRHVRAGEHGH